MYVYCVCVWLRVKTVQFQDQEWRHATIDTATFEDLCFSTWMRQRMSGEWLCTRTGNTGVDIHPHTMIIEYLRRVKQRHRGLTSPSLHLGRETATLSFLFWSQASLPSVSSSEKSTALCTFLLGINWLRGHGFTVFCRGYGSLHSPQLMFNMRKAVHQACGKVSPQADGLCSTCHNAIVLISLSKVASQVTWSQQLIFDLCPTPFFDRTARHKY